MVNNLYVAITIVALSILVFGLVLQNVWLKLQNIKLTTHIFQMEFNHASQADLLIKKIEELDKNVEKESQEGFVKFLNQSRDWAFEYIETVQTVIKELVDKFDRNMKYATKYGDIDPTQQYLVQLSDIYYKLKNLLPKEEVEDASKGSK